MLRQVDPNYLQFAANELRKDKSLGELGVTFKTLQRNFPGMLKKTTRTAPLPNEAPNGLPAARVPEDIDLLPEVTAQNLSVNDKQRLYDMWQEMDENQRVTLRVAAKMMQDMQQQGVKNPHQPPMDVMNNLKREIEAKQHMSVAPKRRR